jgi:DNA-directed RNA polymerase subunit RPC12/RpoP
MQGQPTVTDFITLTCPTCGGKLQITPEIDRFACAHCGKEHLVKRSEGVIAIQPLADSLTGLQRATARAAAELGLRRANEELAGIEARHSSASRAQVEARQALKHGQVRKRSLLLASILTIPGVLFCVGGAMVSYLLMGAAGRTATDDSLSAILCITNSIGLALLVLAMVLLGRAMHTPRPTLSSSQAEKALAAAQAEVNASVAQLQAKQWELEKLWRDVYRDAG